MSCYACAATGAILAFGLDAVAPAQDRPRFKAELVVLHVMVEDHRGAYVTGLAADAFRVFEMAGRRRFAS